MTPVRLSSLATALNARLPGAGPETADPEIREISTDTRTLAPGSLFVALRGENFDGHDHAAVARDKGAAALLVSRQLPDVALPQLVVEDTRKAYGQLGGWLKQQLAPRTLALTGSSGKTTVKQMCARILIRHAGAEQVLATEGNFNNDIGVPKTLLRLTPEHRFAVIELGANHAGEIAWTTSLAKPDVALVTNVAAAHLEGFGSLEGVARAKSEIFQGLAPGAPVVLNRDCPHAMNWLPRLSQQHPVTTFSMQADAGADCYPAEVILTAEGGYRFTLHTAAGSVAVSLALPGRHNIANALAAAAATLALGVPLACIGEALSEFGAVSGRSQLEQLTERLWLVDDAYNANQNSVEAAIDLLAERAGERWLVLGDLKELGEQSLAIHAGLGEYARKRGLDRIFTCGEHSAALVATHFAQQAELLPVLTAAIEQQQCQGSGPLTVLVKGSRSSGMDQAAQAVRERFQLSGDKPC